MGGGTVAAMAIQNESRTQSLILVDGALFNTSRGSFALAFPPLERWAQVILEHALIRRGGIQTFLASAYGKVASPVQIEGYLTPLSLPGTANAASGLIKTAKNEDPMLLASISTPITAIWGSRDTWVPASELDQLKEIRPDVTIRTIEGAAHMPMETHLEEFVHTLLDWLLEKSGGSAS